MIITKIEIQKKNKKRYNLYIDGKFNTGVHEDVIVNLGLHVKQTLTETIYNDILLKEVEANAKQDALKFISYRLRSELEVRDKLLSLDYNEQTIELIIDFLKEHGFINDEYFTKAYIHDKIVISQQSIRRIIYDLKSKGIYEEQVLNIWQNDEELMETNYKNVYKIIEKKYNALLKKGKYNEYELKQRVLQYLGGKGFDFNLIKEVYSDFKEKSIE